VNDHGLNIEIGVPGLLSRDINILAVLKPRITMRGSERIVFHGIYLGRQIIFNKFLILANSRQMQENQGNKEKGKSLLHFI